MIGGFALFIYGGHVPLAMLVLTLQVSRWSVVAVPAVVGGSAPSKLWGLARTACRGAAAGAQGLARGLCGSCKPRQAGTWMLQGSGRWVRGGGPTKRWPHSTGAAVPPNQLPPPACLLQYLMVRELFHMVRVAQNEHGLPGFRAQQW
jgi:hypothetical protein